MQVLQFFKKESPTWFSSLAQTNSPLGLVHFYSILEILRMKINFFLINFFPLESQLNFPL